MLVAADKLITAVANTNQQLVTRTEDSSEVSLSVRRLVREVRALPASAHVLQRVLDEIEEPSVTNHDMEHLLLRDPAITAGVLRLANSAFFGVPSQIRTLNTAVRIVGRRRLKTLLRHLLVGQLFEVLAARGPALTRIRNQALAAGVVCAEIGVSFSELEAEEFRIGGLLHNVAEYFVAGRLPDRYRQYLDWYDSMGPEQAAQAAMGTSFEEAGAIMLENWRFPEIYVNAARWQLHPFEASEQSQRLCMAVQAGRVLSRSWQFAASASDAVAQLDDQIYECLGVEQTEFERIYCDISQSVEALKALLHPVDRR